MPYAAITYHVKPGFEDEIAEIFGNFRRASSPVLHDADGQEVGRLLGTGVFMADGVMVRFIHYEGSASLEDIGRHMAVQPGVHDIEDQLKPYLSQPRDTATPEAFVAYFLRSTMRCISQLSIDSFPGAARAAS